MNIIKPSNDDCSWFMLPSKYALNDMEKMLCSSDDIFSVFRVYELFLMVLLVLSKSKINKFLSKFCVNSFATAVSANRKVLVC